MAIILSLADTASLSSVMICCTTVATFNVSLLLELGGFTCSLNFLLWQMLLYGVPHTFPICLLCLRLLMLRVLKQCRCLGLL
jgi:hypothetical protein